uniref:Mediator complex subunit 27 n=1 Tax=Labrus bergylta TaxID=56723 RepID=A0A3Q3E8Q4_9LABR
MADGVNVGVNLDAFSHAISGIQALRSSVSRVFESLKDGMKNRETLEGREKKFIAEFQDNLQAVNRDLNGLVGRPSESHPLHNSGLLSLDPVQDKLLSTHSCCSLQVVQQGKHELTFCQADRLTS